MKWTKKGEISLTVKSRRGANGHIIPI